MPYYDFDQPQAGGARDRITAALMNIQNPPPMTPQPPPQPQMPQMMGGDATQAATGTPGVTPQQPLGNSMIANMTTPQLPGGQMTSTLAQQQMAAQPSPMAATPAASPAPTQSY